MKAYYLFFIATIIITIKASKLTKFCETDADCSSNEVCGYQQRCDDNGCQRGERRVCIRGAATNSDFQKSQTIDSYLSEKDKEDKIMP